ncbi:MAG: hypothetical protein ABMB14_17445 [Myxococcota bacterium]
MPIVLALLTGCRTEPADDTGGSTTFGEPSGCDPLIPEVCALPWPSSVFEAVDPSTVTGRRLALGPDSLPVNRDGVKIDPAMVNRKDGFSTVGPVVVWFDGLPTDGVVPGTIRHDDLDAVYAGDAKTVIVDTVTHERVPHFVELDMAADDPAQRVLFLRPVAPLAHARRYVVGIRGLTRADGAPVAVSDAFAALRDGTASTDPDVLSRRATFDELVVPELEAQGFGRGELQLGWDFGTVSQESSLGPVVAMRDDALARIGAGPAYTIDSVEEGDCAVEGEHVARTVLGHLTAPRYTDVDAPKAKLVYGDDGLPVYSGDTSVEFLVRIPCSLAVDPGTGGRVVQYGHGLFGDVDEARSGYLGELIDANRWVLIAQNWTGMSSADAPYITLMLTLDLSDFDMIPDRTTQGFVEWVVGLRLARGALADDPALAFGGASVIDPALEPVFYGNSQGAIFGGAYTALSPDIARGVLGVGGMPYSLLLSRSADFTPFFSVFEEKYPDRRDIGLILAALQTAWDPGEAGGYANVLGATPLPGSPPKRILMQNAIGDAQVNTLGGQFGARAVGAVSVGPAVRPIWGIDEVTGPIDGSAITEWHYADGPVEPFDNVPPDSAVDTHECPRREPAAQLQLAKFVETGIVEQFCDGPCESVRAGLCD